MNDVYPDIEIYILKASHQEIQAWLESVFEAVSIQQQTATQCHFLVDGMKVVFIEKANKHFSSLWFTRNQTPWPNDLDCARAAHAALDKEVRCSEGGWQESSDQEAPSSWIKLLHGREKSCDWT